MCVLYALDNMTQDNSKALPSFRSLQMNKKSKWQNQTNPFVRSVRILEQIISSAQQTDYLSVTRTWQAINSVCAAQPLRTIQIATGNRLLIFMLASNYAHKRILKIRKHNYHLLPTKPHSSQSQKALTISRQQTASSPTVASM